MRKLLVLGMCLACLMCAGTAQAANYAVRLPASEARAIVREAGAAVHQCERLAPRRFRCSATYWSVEHVAEEVEPGVWVEVSAIPVRDDVVLIVGLFGVRLA